MAGRIAACASEEVAAKQLLNGRDASSSVAFLSETDGLGRK